MLPFVLFCFTQHLARPYTHTNFTTTALLFPCTPLHITDDDDDLFDSDEEEEISKRVLDGEDGASGPPEGWNGGRGKAGKKVCCVVLRWL